MTTPTFHRVHLITGGFPVGSLAGHDMDYARHRLLGLLREFDDIRVTVGNDYKDIERWLPGTDLLITYVAGPFATDEEAAYLNQWMDEGGRWLALHGSSGGKAIRVDTPEGRRKRMVKASHHEAIGSFFLNPPPIRRFQVDVADRNHPLTTGLPEHFEAADELYLIELQDPASTNILLTTQLEEDPSPAGFGFTYEEDTSRLDGGATRVIGYEKPVGKGGVAYVALGHCHSPQSNTQPFVDDSVREGGTTPNPFHGSWEQEPLPLLVRNGIRWGIGVA